MRSRGAEEERGRSIVYFEGVKFFSLMRAEVMIFSRLIKSRIMFDFVLIIKFL